MHAKDFFFNECGYRHGVEAIHKRFPYFDIVPALALLEEAIDAGNGSRLMISP